MYRDKDQVNKAKIENAPQQYSAKHLTEDGCSQSRIIQEIMQISSRASRWYGHQEETVTANIENKTAKVESISSDMASERRQPVQILAEENRHTEH